MLPPSSVHIYVCTYNTCLHLNMLYALALVAAVLSYTFYLWGSLNWVITIKLPATKEQHFFLYNLKFVFFFSSFFLFFFLFFFWFVSSYVCCINIFAYSALTYHHTLLVFIFYTNPLLPPPPHYSIIILFVTVYTKQLLL